MQQSRKRHGILLLAFLVSLSVLVISACAEGDAEVSRFFGTWVSLVPPVVAIGLALITKEVYSSLFIGIIVGFFLQADMNPVAAFELFINELGGNVGGNAGILIFLVILGTMVALMIRVMASSRWFPPS